MASEQSSPEINADNLNSSAADVHVQPPGEKEWSDGFYDKEVINGNTPDAPKRGFLGYLIIYLLCYPVSFGGFYLVGIVVLLQASSIWITLK